MASILRQNFGDARLPSPSVWTVAAGAVRRHQRKRWTNADAAVLAVAVRAAQHERAVLGAAAAILTADARCAPASFQPHYETAVRMLRLPRRASDNARDHVSRIGAQGPAWRGWTYTVRELLGSIVPVLMAAGVPVSSRHTSPFVKSVREILAFIYPPAELPAPTTLSKVVADYLDG